MTAAGILDGTTFPGVPASIARVRRHVRTAAARYGPDVADTAELLASEAATNAITHSRSGNPGGHIGVKVTHADGVVRVQVRDQGSADSAPRIQPDTGPTPEHGLGLVLVETLANCWGTEPTGDGGALVWFELEIPGLERAG